MIKSHKIVIIIRTMHNIICIIMHEYTNNHTDKIHFKNKFKMSSNWNLFKMDYLKAYYLHKHTIMIYLQHILYTYCKIYII